MSTLTSAVFDAWAWLTSELRSVSWPAPDVGDDDVQVWFGDPSLTPPDIAAALERVVVVGTVRVPDQEWGPVGNMARDERFAVPVFVQSMGPFDAEVGMSPSEGAAARLAALTAAVEQLVWATNIARRSGTVPTQFRKYPAWGVQVGQVVPMTPPGPEGAVGVAEVVIEFQFRVGSPPVDA